MENKSKFYSIWLALVCIIVFILQKIIPGFTETFLLSSDALSMPWQFLTAIFLHGSLMHLLYNLFALVLFGIILEKFIGSKRFLILFLVSGILANLIAFMFYPSSLGASGAIMAIIGVLAIIRPIMVVWAFNLPMPMFVLVIIWVVGSVLGVFGIGDTSTGYWAHLSGIFIGLIYGLFLRLKHGFFESKTTRREPEVISEDYMRMWEDRHLKR